MVAASWVKRGQKDRIHHYDPSHQRSLFVDAPTSHFSALPGMIPRPLFEGIKRAFKSGLNAPQQSVSPCLKPSVLMRAGVQCMQMVKVKVNSLRPESP